MGEVRLWENGWGEVFMLSWGKCSSGMFINILMDPND